MTSKKHIIAGIDDATKCPCIGSIFIAGVVANQEIIDLWQASGVKDSKLLTRQKRDQLAILIKETAIAYQISQIEPFMIDNKILNLNQWEMAVVLDNASKLFNQTNFDEIYLDNWEVNTKLFFERLNFISNYDFKQIQNIDIAINKEKLESVKIIAEHRADENYVIVGAASILAKVASDAQYDDYRKIYGDFGSGSPADPKTRLFVWQNRKNPLPIIRQSWNTFKVLSKLKKIEHDVIYSRVLNNKKLKAKI